MADCIDECSLRCFPNQWLKDPFCKLKTKPSQEGDESQMLLTAEIRPRLLSEINKCLRKIEEYYSTNTRDQSIYTGSTGVSLFYLHMALQLHPNDEHQKRQLLSKSLSFIRPCLAKLDTHRHTFLCGAPGPLAIASVVFMHLDRKAEAMDSIEKLVAIYKTQKDEFKKKLPCELLYGCAGYLYSLLFVNSYINNGINRDIIEEVQELLISQGQCGRDTATPSPLMYSWHSKRYLGAAHGLAGILTVLLQDSKDSAVVSRNLDNIQGTIGYLLSLQLPSKNFPSSIESMGKDRLVQWCHGAPGFVHLWSTAYRVFGKSDYLKAAKDCGEVVWEKGLLRKGYSLCHGVSGNGYTFLQLYRTTGDQCYLHRALKYAEWCVSSNDRDCPESDRPLSLFEGLLGKIYFYLELCVDPVQARFPAIELLHVQSKLDIT